MANDKLAEAKKLIEKWPKIKREAIKFVDYISPREIDELLYAQSLISYEKGRDEQRKEDIEIIRRDATEFLLFIVVFEVSTTIKGCDAGVVKLINYDPNYP